MNAMPDSTDPTPSIAKKTSNHKKVGARNAPAAETTWSVIPVSSSDLCPKRIVKTLTANPVATAAANPIVLSWLVMPTVT